MTNISDLNLFLEEVEVGVMGLKAQWWSDHSGDWWLRFIRMACQDGNDSFDYACVPILVMDYLFAPTQWVMANGDGGMFIIYNYGDKYGQNWVYSANLYLFTYFYGLIFINILLRSMGNIWSLRPCWQIEPSSICH